MTHYEETRPQALRGQIEQAVVNAVETLNASGKLGYTIDYIAGYRGELDDIRDLVGRRRTAVLVAYCGKRLIRETGFSKEYEATYSVVVYSRNSTRNEKDSRLGTSDTVGSYQLAADIEKLLDGQDFGLLSAPFNLVKETPIMNGQVTSYHVGAAELEFTCEIEISRNGFDDPAYSELNPFETVVTNWECPEISFTSEQKLPQTKENTPHD